MSGGYRLLYSELLVEHSLLQGGCNQWAVLTSSLTYYLQTTKLVTNITTVQSTSLLESYEQVDSITCSNVASLESIVTAMVAPSSTRNVPIPCDGHMWTIQQCWGGHVTVCVNCSLSPCVTSQRICPSSTSVPLWGCTSPCQYTNGKGSMAAIVVHLTDQFPPLALLRTNISHVSSTNLTISMQVSSLGVVYCAALPSPAIATGSFIRHVNVFTPVVARGGGYWASLTIPALSPATSYDIFCLTESLRGVVLPDADIVRGKVSGHTGCCKTIRITLLTTSMVVGSDVLSALSVSISSRPSEEIVLSLECLFVPSTGGSNASQQVHPFFKTALEFQASTQLLTRTIGFRATRAGQYYPQFLLSGTSAVNYEIVYMGDTSISVREKLVEPTPPKIASAVFSTNGLTLGITFDRVTNKAYLPSVFPCSNLFVFPGVNVSTCQWTSASRVMSYTPSHVQVGGTITLLPSVLKAACSQPTNNCTAWKYAPVSTVIVKAPLIATPPVVSLSMPALIGSCNNLTIDLSSSSGSGGRPWHVIRIDVRSIDPNVSSIAQFLLQEYKLYPPTPIPRTLLQPGYGYTFIATLCNFLGGCSSATERVIVSTGVVPSLHLDGSSQITLHRRDVLELTVTAYTTECDGSRSSANIMYFWSISTSLGALIGPAYKSFSVDPRKFKLKPNTFSVSQFYTVTVTALHTLSRQSSSLTATVYIEPSVIIASIAGGYDQSIRLGESLLIDGSQSYDQDTNSRLGLSFSWECVQVMPSYSNACPLDTHVTANEAILEIWAPLQAVNTTARITMSVFDGLRLAEQIVDVGVVSPAAPTVTITSTVRSINSNEKLKLSGVVSLETTGVVSWSVDEGIVQLTDLSLTPLAWTLSDITKPQSGVFPLVLVSNTLPMRTTLTFRLMCVLTTGQFTSSAITITINGPPLGGRLTASPTEGNMISTVFSLLATRWEDDNLPLSYEFGYVSVTGHSLLLQSKSLKTSTASPLPNGRDLDGSLVTFVWVYDFLLANSTAHVTVTVRKVEVSTQDMNAGLDQLSDEGSVEDLKKLLAVTTTIANAVDCSLSPDCTTFNRKSCASVANTCSDCLTGYEGRVGSDNSLCLLNNRKLALSESCVVDSACDDERSVCVGGKCEMPLLECVQNCSGHGECIYRDRTLYRRHEACRQTDYKCEGVCECRSGYGGLDCSWASGELEARKMLRQKLLSRLGNITQSEDAVRQNIQSWIDLLVAIVASLKSCLGRQWSRWFL